MAFADRSTAGRQLAEELAHLRLVAPVVLGLPRGGVPVAFEVARRLRAPLDVLVVRKLGLPGHVELGMGALSEGDFEVLNRGLLAQMQVAPRQLDRVRRTERAELARRLQRYRRGRPPIELAGRTAVLIDDGLATGYTAKAAVQAARGRDAERIVLAVPVGPSESVSELSEVADQVVCLLQPEWFTAVGSYYRDFRQVTDAEVAELLERAATAPWRSGSDEPPPERARSSRP